MCERSGEQGAPLITGMWCSCPDPTSSLFASAVAGGAVALACDYLRRIAALRAAQERALHAVGSLGLGVAAHVCALWHSELHGRRRIVGANAAVAAPA
jgi:hypothetical protein